MSQVAMTINGRIYRLTCEDGEEERLMQLGAMVADRVATFTETFGQVGGDRLLFLAALRLADELVDATATTHTKSTVETLAPKKPEKRPAGMSADVEAPTDANSKADAKPAPTGPDAPKEAANPEPASAQ